MYYTGEKERELYMGVCQTSPSRIRLLYICYKLFAGATDRLKAAGAARGYRRTEVLRCADCHSRGPFPACVMSLCQTRHRRPDILRLIHSGVIKTSSVWHKTGSSQVV